MAKIPRFCAFLLAKKAAVQRPGLDSIVTESKKPILDSNFMNFVTNQIVFEELFPIIEKHENG